MNIEDVTIIGNMTVHNSSNVLSIRLFKNFQLI